MTDEIWIPITGFEGLYEISNLGRVKSLARTVRKGAYHHGIQQHAETILNCCFLGSQLRAALYDNKPGSAGRSKNKRFPIARSVYEYFIGPIPKKHVVRFKDRNPRNCAATNLYTMSRAELLKYNKENAA